MPDDPHDPLRSGVFTSVLAIGLATVVALVALLVWDGGGPPATDRAEAGSAPFAAFAAPDGPAIGSGGGGSSGGNEGAQAAPSVGSAEATDRPFETATLAPFGGRLVSPQASYVDLEWEVVGTTWQEVLAVYQAAFPAPGHELGRLTRTWGGAAGEAGQGHEVVPAGSGEAGAAIGTLDVHLADDGTTVLVTWDAR